jgi:hypothetical protein
VGTIVLNHPGLDTFMKGDDREMGVKEIIISLKFVNIRSFITSKHVCIH